MIRREFAVTVACAVVALLQSPSAALQERAAGSDGIAVRSAMADGVSLQYLTAGHGPTIVLLHGYAETSRMWRPLIPRLAAHFTVIARTCRVSADRRFLRMDWTWRLRRAGCTRSSSNWRPARPPSSDTTSA